jgi:hypothetical protein
VNYLTERTEKFMGRISGIVCADAQMIPLETCDVSSLDSVFSTLALSQEGS